MHTLVPLALSTYLLTWFVLYSTANPDSRPDKHLPEQLKAPPTKAADPWEGVYAIVPQDDNHTAGSVVVRRVGDSYLVLWAVTTVIPMDDGAKVGVQHAEGIGLADGNRLSVAWRAGDAFGVTVYTRDGRALTGRWVMMPGGRERTEELRRVAGLGGRT